MANTSKQSTIIELDPRSYANVSDNLRRLILLSSVNEVTTVLRAAVKPMGKAIRQKAPVGNLQPRPSRTKINKSVSATAKKGNRGKMPMGMVNIRRTAYHWLFQEMGTERIKARPWINEAVNSVQDEVRSIMVVGMRKVIQSVVSG